MVYLAEAHFVERDAGGNYVDGWPIGYKDFEYPQHKSLGNRIDMARLTVETLQSLKKAEMVVVDSFENSFHETFGAWPDQAFVIIDGKLKAITILCRGASRTNNSYHLHFL